MILPSILYFLNPAQRNSELVNKALIDASNKRKIKYNPFIYDGTIASIVNTLKLIRYKPFDAVIAPRVHHKRIRQYNRRWRVFEIDSFVNEYFDNDGLVGFVTGDDGKPGLGSYSDGHHQDEDGHSGYGIGWEIGDGKAPWDEAIERLFGENIPRGNPYMGRYGIGEGWVTWALKQMWDRDKVYRDWKKEQDEKEKNAQPVGDDYPATPDEEDDIPGEPVGTPSDEEDEEKPEPPAGREPDDSGYDVLLLLRELLAKERFKQEYLDTKAGKPEKTDLKLEFIGWLKSLGIKTESFNKGLLIGDDDTIYSALFWVYQNLKSDHPPSIFFQYLMRKGAPIDPLIPPTNRREVSFIGGRFDETGDTQLKLTFLN
jgi:hypothetical protein